MARRTRKRRKKPEESSLFYTVAITGWSWAFDFGVNRGNRLSSDPYSEHRHLEIKGRLLEPDGIKAECALVTLMPDARLNQSSRQKDTAHAVVSINVRDGVLYGLGSMPGDALAPVLQLLSAQRPVYLFLHGERLRYRKALIWSYRLDTAWEGDEQAEAEPPGD